MRADRPDARLIAAIDKRGALRFPTDDSDIAADAVLRILHFSPGKKERQQVPPEG